MQVAVDGTVLSSFVRDGFVCFEGAVESDDLKALEVEFDHLVEHGPHLSDQRFENGFCVSVAGAAAANSPDRYPQLAAFIADPILQSLITAYFLCFYENPATLPAPAFHSQLDLEENQRAGGTSNSHWHFDRVPCVKCALFFNRIDMQCGPFSVVPGSHFQTRERALRHLEVNPDPLFVDSYVDLKSEPETRTFVVEPGTMVVFDTYLIHQGGGVTGNGRRKTMRAVTWPPLLNRTYLEPTRLKPDRSGDLEFDTFFPHDRTGQSVTDPRLLFQG